MALPRGFMLGAAILATLTACATLSACATDPPGPEPDRLAGVDWAKFLARCPIGEARGYGMKIDGIVKGDVNGDRYPETLVIDSCDSPTASNPQTVEVFDGNSDPSAPTKLGILMQNDPDYPRRMSVSVSPDRTVVVNALGLQPESPRCCPDLKLTTTFAWRDGRFVQLSREEKPI